MNGSSSICASSGAPAGSLGQIRASPVEPVGGALTKSENRHVDIFKP